MEYEIVAVSARLFETTSRDPLTTSLHEGYIRQVFVLVRLEASGGAVGIGEAPAFITGETAETMLIALREHLAPALLGHDLRDIPGLHRIMRHVFPNGNRAAFSAIDLAAHDAVHEPADALRAINEGGCDLINIKLLKAGGFYPAAQIATICAAAGINCQIGLTLTSIGTVAAVHLIHAHAVIPLPEINWPDRLVSNPAEGFVIEDGKASIPEAPGLGLAANEHVAETAFALGSHWTGSQNEA